MNIDFLYELNSSQAASVILNILDNFDQNFEKNLKIIEKIMEFLEDRDFKNPYSSIIGSLSNINFSNVEKEDKIVSMAETSRFKNLIKLKQYVYERCQIAYLSNKIALGYKEKKCYNLDQYIEYIPIKGELNEKLFELNKSQIEIYKKLKQLFSPKIGNLKINVIGSKTRRFLERKYLIKNSLSVKIVSYIYTCLGKENYENSVIFLSKDLFRFYLFHSLRERESSKVFPGIAAIPDFDLLNFLNVPGVSDPIRLIQEKIIREKIEKSGTYEVGIKILYENNIDKKVICDLANIDEDELNKILNLNVAKTDRAKQFLEELL